MNDMFTVNATDVRKNWSTFFDGVVRTKPAFVKRTHDSVVAVDDNMLKDMLYAYSLSAKEYIEPDGSITLSLNEIDIVENAETLDKAKKLLAQSIKDYAYDYYEDFQYWFAAPNRKAHLPYVMKVLLLDNIDKIEECISCHLSEI